MKKCGKMRKVYADGGAMGAGGWSTVGQLAGAASAMLDGFTPVNRSPSIGMQAGKMALSGAAAGAVAGPWGAAIGGVVGGIAGGVKGAIDKKKEQVAYAKQQQKVMLQNYDRGAAALGNDPSLANGRANVDYYDMGGELKELNPMNGQPQIGGSLKPLSSYSSEVQGPSHEDGGVELPEMNAELEGNETVAGNKVFSERLGFAQLHKPLARAIGKIETKPATMDRINAMKRLQDKENQLYARQEQVKQILNAIHNG